MHLYLVRHGATEWSELGRHTGRTDLSLLEKGEQQARALRSILASRPFVRVLSSPLCRAHKTAELAGFSNRLETTDLLLEMDYGQDEGRTRAEIRAERPGWDIFEHGPQGGERLEDVARRATEFLASLTAKEEENVLIFSHGHMLRVLTAVFLKLPPTAGKHFEIGPASLSVLGFSHEFPSIERWNDQHHVESIEA